MLDNVNPPSQPIDPNDYATCDNCCKSVFKDFLKKVWTSIWDEDCKDFCSQCVHEHAKPHPMFNDELWEVGSVDTENQLTIK